MYWQDLSPQSDRMPNRLAVGWLSSGVPFRTGPTSTLFRQRLRELCWLPTCLTCGYHECEFCASHSAHGNGEIVLRASDGKVYFAPAMIIHYVEAHGYCPPDAFIEAVERLPKYEWPVPVPELSDRVRAVSNNRTLENWDAFVATFLKSRVGVGAWALDEPRVAINPLHQTEFLETKSGQKIQLMRGGVVRDLSSPPELHLGLYVVSDFENGRGPETGDYVGFEVSELLCPAANVGAEICINTSPPGHPSFLTVTAEEVSKLSESLRGQ